MSAHWPDNADAWIQEIGPDSDIVVSSRTRLARNLPGLPFAPRATRQQLSAVAEAIAQPIDRSESFKDYRRFEMSALTGLDRRFLKESHLISPEMEKGGEHRQVYLNGDGRTSIMVNEEDHLRLQTMIAGFRVGESYAAIEALEKTLEEVLEFAYNPQFGYLSACPTNTGTGLRVSVMLHLVGLVMTGKIDEALGSVGNFGLVVRGAYGEHSNHAGDLFQVSNEVTLGKTEESLIAVLDQVVRQVIERERAARRWLFERQEVKCEDAVLRAVGVLSHARSMNTEEAVTLLSRVRLGLGRSGGPRMTHEEMNRLLIDVQPAHLRRRAKLEEEAIEEGDQARATYLRKIFGSANGGPPNVETEK